MLLPDELIGRYTICFEDDFKNQDKINCSVIIKLNKKKTCFVITLEWCVINGPIDIKQNQAFPFYNMNCDDYNIDGVIIAINEMTTTKIQYLLMDDEILQPWCGLGTANRYRRIIIRQLMELWD